MADSDPEKGRKCPCFGGKNLFGKYQEHSKMTSSKKGFYTKNNNQTVVNIASNAKQMCFKM